MKLFFSGVLNGLYVLFFALLLAATVALFWFYARPLFWFYAINLAGLFVRLIFNLNDPLTLYFKNNMLALDQAWQVAHKFLLNLGVKTRHRFGYVDETASSVIGKNLKEKPASRWRIIEFFLSLILEGGRPHSIPGIEADEGANKQ